jgi:hypothetical protein
MLGEHGMGPNVVQEPFVRPGPNRSNGSVSGSWRGSCTYLQQIPSRHRDTIAGPRVDLDDLLLLQFVLHTEDKPCIVRAELEIVDDYPFDLRFERSQDVRYQIVGERPFLLRALHEHRDRRPNALIDEDHESLFLVAKKNGEAAAGRSDGPDVHFDNGLTHTASLYSPSRKDPNYCPPRWRPNDCFRGA